jgi:protein TonB
MTRVSANRRGVAPLLLAGILSLALHAAFASALLFWWRGVPDAADAAGARVMNVELVHLAAPEDDADAASAPPSAALAPADAAERGVQAALDPPAPVAESPPTRPEVAVDTPHPEEPRAREAAAAPPPKTKRIAQRKLPPVPPRQEAPPDRTPPSPAPASADAAAAPAPPADPGEPGRELPGASSAAAFGVSRAVSIVRNMPPDYPAAARRRGLQGRVVVRVEVDAEGIPDDIEVIASSGHDLLDRRAVETVREWRFAPALRDGTPVAELIDVPIVFRLERDRFARY